MTRKEAERLFDEYGKVALEALITKMPLINRDEDFPESETPQDTLDEHKIEICRAAHAYAFMMLETREEIVDTLHHIPYLKEAFFDERRVSHKTLDENSDPDAFVEGPLSNHLEGKYRDAVLNSYKFSGKSTGRYFEEEVPVRSVGDIRDDAAELAHKIWCDGMKYMFKYGREYAVNSEDIVLDGAKVARWKRQMNTEFSELIETEKESDYKIADAMIMPFFLKNSESKVYTNDFVHPSIAFKDDISKGEYEKTLESIYSNSEMSRNDFKDHVFNKMNGFLHPDTPPVDLEQSIMSKEEKESILDLGGMVGILNGLIEDAKKAKSKSLFDVSQISDGYHTFGELYEFRKMYHAALANEWASGFMAYFNDCAEKKLAFLPEAAPELKYDVHKSWKHGDGEDCFGGGWFIVVAVLPDGQISNHYEAKDWDLFNIPSFPTAKYKFDGHTGADVLLRLANICKTP